MPNFDSMRKYRQKKNDRSTVVCDSINIMKTIFDFNFDLLQALNSMNTQKHGNKVKLSILFCNL